MTTPEPTDELEQILKPLHPRKGTGVKQSDVIAKLAARESAIKEAAEKEQFLLMSAILRHYGGRIEISKADFQDALPGDTIERTEVPGADITVFRLFEASTERTDT